MADGAREERWNHTAALRADIHNLLAKEPVSPLKFHPFHRHEKPAPVKPQPGAVEALARAICGDAACDAKWGKADKPPA